MPVAPYAVTYVVNGISNTPTLIDHLLISPNWDIRPDPSRFTLREVVAHWADWDEIWIDRIRTTLAEEHPILPNMDEGLIAEEREYSKIPPEISLSRLRQSRPQLVELIRTIPEDAWDRMAHRTGVGDLTLFQLVVMIMGHDNYHLKQLCDFQD